MNYLQLAILVASSPVKNEANFQREEKEDFAKDFLQKETQDRQNVMERLYATLHCCDFIATFKQPYLVGDCGWNYCVRPLQLRAVKSHPHHFSLFLKFFCEILLQFSAIFLNKHKLQTTKTAHLV